MPSEAFYIRSAAWSPDDSTVYTGTPASTQRRTRTGTAPRTGLCDSVAAFPAQQTSVLHTWVNYTGCDSLYSAAADANAAYFGGHERFSMNANDCDALGNGGYNAPGMEGLDPANGNLYVLRRERRLLQPGPGPGRGRHAGNQRRPLDR